MRNLIMIAAAALSLSATSCVVRERPVAYHHVGPGPRYVAPPPRHERYEYRDYRDDRGYRDRTRVYVR
jgi:hypothetical protein